MGKNPCRSKVLASLRTGGRPCQAAMSRGHRSLVLYIRLLRQGLCMAIRPFCFHSVLSRPARRGSLRRPVHRRRQHPGLMSVKTNGAAHCIKRSDYAATKHVALVQPVRRSDEEASSGQGTDQLLLLFRLKPQNALPVSRCGSGAPPSSAPLRCAPSWRRRAPPAPCPIPSAAKTP